MGSVGSGMRGVEPASGTVVGVTTEEDAAPAPSGAWWTSAHGYAALIFIRMHQLVRPSHAVRVRCPVRASHGPAKRSTSVLYI